MISELVKRHFDCSLEFAFFLCCYFSLSTFHP